MSIMGLYGKYHSHKHKNKNRLQYITIIYQVKILSKSRSACWGSMRRTLTIPGEPRPAGAAGEDVLDAGAAVHHVRGLREDRAWDRHRHGSG